MNCGSLRCIATGVHCDQRNQLAGINQGHIVMCNMISIAVVRHGVLSVSALVVDLYLHVDHKLDNEIEPTIFLRGNDKESTILLASQ